MPTDTSNLQNSTIYAPELVSSQFRGRKEAKGLRAASMEVRTACCVAKTVTDRSEHREAGAQVHQASRARVAASTAKLFVWHLASQQSTRLRASVTATPRVCFV